MAAEMNMTTDCAQGGDLGSFISRQAAADYPESCKAFHGQLNFPLWHSANW